MKINWKQIEKANKDCIYEFICSHCRDKSTLELTDLFAKEIIEYQKHSFDEGYKQATADFIKIINKWYKNLDQYTMGELLDEDLEELKQMLVGK
jgi:hypothetical protein